MVKDQIKIILYGLGGALVGWLVAALAVVLIAVIAGILEAVLFRPLAFIVALITLAFPFIPPGCVHIAAGAASLDAASSPRAKGVMVALVVLIFSSVPLVLVSLLGSPGLFHTIMTDMFELWDWVGIFATYCAIAIALVTPVMSYRAIVRANMNEKAQ